MAMFFAMWSVRMVNCEWRMYFLAASLLPLVQSPLSKSYRLVQFRKLKIYCLVQFRIVIH